LAIYGGFMLALAFALALALAGDRTEVVQLAGILAGASLVAALGAWDDRRPLSPAVKVAGELLAGGILVAADVRVSLLTGRLADPAGPVLDILLTLLWVLAVTNAANLLDNMDGALAGVTAVAAAALALLAHGSGQLLVAPLAAALCGASLGFLYHNRSPAHIFMGDAGSLFVGFVLAALGIKLRFPGQPPSATWMVPLLVMAVLLFDTLLVSLSRLRRGLNPLTAGGKDHLAHRLVAAGATPREAVQLLWLMGAASSALALFVSRLAGRDPWAVRLCLGAVVVAGVWGLWRLEWHPEARRGL
jgi:UDP-GlcNAc:undecaprenyl-phosphate GlcNAc-1-phosphate transferase